MPFPKKNPALFDGRQVDLTKLAKDADINLSHASRIMRGKKDPSITVLLRLADALAMAPDYFLEQLLTVRQTSQE